MLIISIRIDSGEDRITCEFNAIDGRCVQSRYFSNQEIPEKYKTPLDMVKGRVKILAKENKLKPINIKKIPLVIDGITIIPKVKENNTILPFFEMGREFM